jgi:hypothetical protein
MSVSFFKLLFKIFEAIENEGESNCFENIAEFVDVILLLL